MTARWMMRERLGLVHALPGVGRAAQGVGLHAAGT